VTVPGRPNASTCSSGTAEVVRQMAAQEDCLKLLDTKIDIYTRQLQQER